MTWRGSGHRAVPVPEWWAAGARFGIEAADLNDDIDTAAMLIEMTGGRGPDVMIDAVGMEAHGHDTAAGSKLAEVAQRATGDRCPTGWRRRSPTWPPSTGSTRCNYRGQGGAPRRHGLGQRRLRRRGRPHADDGRGSDRGIQLRMGQAHVKRWIDDLMPLVADGSDPLGVQSFATHHLALEEAPRGYEMFRDKALTGA